MIDVSKLEAKNVSILSIFFMDPTMPEDEIAYVWDLNGHRAIPHQGMAICVIPKQEAEDKAQNLDDRKDVQDLKAMLGNRKVTGQTLKAVPIISFEGESLLTKEVLKEISANERSLIEASILCLKARRDARNRLKKGKLIACDFQPH